MNSDRLQNLEDLFLQEIREGHLKGCSVMVVHKGAAQFRGEYGTDRRDSIYRIYSMTKPITAVAVMMLMERGLIDVEEPLYRYIPEFEHMTVVTRVGEVPAKNFITIADCLNMTSGMVYPGEDSVSAIRLLKEAERVAVRQEFGENISALALARSVATVPLLFEPGSRWHYGVSADVLAGLVERVTGMRYGEFLKRAIFTPLDMKDTMYVSALGDKAERLAAIYCRNDDGSVTPITDAQVEKLDSEAFCSVRATSFDGGGSGLCSTLADYSKFAMMLLNNGEYNGARILSRKTVDFLHTDQLPERVRKTVDFEQVKGYSYSNLLRIMKDTGQARSNGTAGEYGWDGMLGTYFLIDPKEELIVIYGQQVLNGDTKTLIRKMRSIVYSAL